MRDPGQFGSNKPPVGSASSGPLDCAAVELWLAAAAEKTLPSGVAEQLRAHSADCAACKEKLAQARRGREWLLVLKQESFETPVDLVAKILARTSLASATEQASVPIRKVLDFAKSDAEHQRAPDVAGHLPDSNAVPANPSTPAWQRSSVVVLRRTFLEPRLALVAAMAFFSISLTLNLIGIRLTNLHAADLSPRNMHRAVTRQYADANAHVVRYYENLRIVYEVEARVQQLRRAAETSTPTQQGAKPRKQSSDSSGNSSNDSSTGRVNYAASHPPSPPSLSTDRSAEATAGHTLATSFVTPFATQVSSQLAPQASSCPLQTICSSMHYFSIRGRRLA